MNNGVPKGNSPRSRNDSCLICQNSVNQGVGLNPALTGQAGNRKIAAHSQPGEKALLRREEGDRCARTGGWILMAALGCSEIALAEEPLRPIALGRLLVYPSAVASVTRDDNVFRANQEDPGLGVIANSSTGIEGEASIGMPANPGNEGNANCRIRRVPANAIARPAAPPHNDSRMLSETACLTIRDARAPSAMLRR